VHEIETVRLWARLYAWSWVVLPLVVVGGAVRAAAVVVIAAAWVRLVASCLGTWRVRRHGASTLARGLLTGPVGAVWLRRRLRRDLGVTHLRLPQA
jgi:hypothetical protein